MKNAYNQDYDSNKMGTPALAKMILLESVTKKLRIKNFCKQFLDQGGLRWLGRWLRPLPDGSYPNTGLATEILTTLGGLNVSDEIDRLGEVEKVLWCYADGSAISNH